MAKCVMIVFTGQIMTKFDLIVADPPWSFDDGLNMSSVKRGAESNYAVLNIEAIKQLKVNEVAADNAVLALWVPSSLLQEGLDTMKAWGFRQTQTHIWIKIKNEPFEEFLRIFKKKHGNNSFNPVLKSFSAYLGYIVRLLALDFASFDFDQILAFGMGRLFRQTHEVCLLGVRGKAYELLENKSQRSVHFDVNKKHSAKPEILQNRLELMYPKASKLEMFARRSRAGWTCIGLQCPDSLGEDIRDSLNKLINST